MHLVFGTENIRASHCCGEHFKQCKKKKCANKKNPLMNTSKVVLSDALEIDIKEKLQL